MSARGKKLSQDAIEEAYFRQAEFVETPLEQILGKYQVALPAPSAIAPGEGGVEE